MEVQHQIGVWNWANGQALNNLNWQGLPDTVADRPAAVLALLLDATLVINSAAGGAGITGRNQFDFLEQIFIKSGHPAEEIPRVNNLSSGQCRVLETMMLGVEPPIPTDLAAAGGAATKQIRVLVPMCDLGADRPKDTAAAVALLKKAGALSAKSASSPSALGGNANDTITSCVITVTAILTDLKEGEVPSPISMSFMDINGANDVVSRVGRYRWATLVQQGFSGGEFAAGTLTDFTRLHVGDNQIYQQIGARAAIEKFNKARILEAASRRVAPVDTASGLSDFFPLIWPEKDQSGLAVPFGPLKFFTAGTLQNFRILVVELGDMKDTQEEEVLIGIGYDEAAVKAVPKAARVPKTTRPPADGHLKMSARKRALLPKVFTTLTRADRKAKNPGGA